MPVRWYSDKKDCVLMEFTQPWSWDHFYEQVHEAHALARSVDYPVDLLVWHHVDLPRGNALLHFHAAFKDQPENIRRVIVIYPDTMAFLLRFFQGLVKIIEGVFPTKGKVKIARSFEEAESILREALPVS
jgi:hypothetical protein